MSGTIYGKAKPALLAVGDLDPVHLLEVYCVVAAEADGRARLLEPQSQEIVDVALDLLLEVADGSSRQFVDAAAIERPSAIAVIERNDNTAVGPIQTVDTDQKREDRVPPLADILRPVLIRVAAVVGKLNVADGLAIVTKKHAASLAQAFMDLRITRAAQAVDQIGEKLLALGLALLGHHGIGPLRPTARSGPTGCKQNRCRDWDELYPHRTEPPFTLMISPVMKLARSEATKRMGPAISSAVAARPRGMTEEAIFWPAFVSSTGLDMSVATQPGATEFTRMLCRASSAARPLVRLMTPPLDAP